MNASDSRLRLPPEVVRRKRGEKFLFLNPSNPDWVVTNANGAAALELCDGRRTVAQIARELSAIGGCDLTEEVVAFLGEVASSTTMFKTIGRENDARPRGSLRAVHLSLTSACNLQCVYCYAAGHEEPDGLLTLEEFMGVIDSVNRMSRGAQIVLTGGEPLASPHALRLAEYAKKRGNGAHLLTNGLLITEESSGRIAETFDLVKVSIDGSSAEVHESHRGRGTFEKALRAVDMLDSRGAELLIAMTVTRRNIHDVPEMARRFGRRLTFAPLFAAGRARQAERLGITGREYFEALASADGVSPMGAVARNLASARNRGVLKCAIGDAEISVSETGGVYPCHLLHLPEFLAGNVRERPLEEIYAASDVLRRSSGLVVGRIEGCGECPIRLICGGACRARAFFEKGRIDVADDFCRYEQEAYLDGLFEMHDLG